MSKRHVLMALMAALLLMTSLVGSVSANDDGGGSSSMIHLLAARLNGANEIAPDGKPNAGDPDGSGHAQIALTEKQVCFLITVRKIDEVTLGHIHFGNAGTNGPVVVDFSLTQSKFRHGRAWGCVDATHELIHRIHTNPAAYYVNIHTKLFPRGAVRGQLKHLADVKV